MTEDPVYVGLDGGGTRLRALVAGADGSELGRAEVPAAPVRAGEPGPVVQAIRRAVVAALEVAGATGRPVASLWAGLAGAGREAVRSELESALNRSGLARRVAVGTDVDAAFEDAFGDGPGILLLSGTGSIALGRASDGRMGRVGGWGSLLGDEGSGHAIGLEALRRVARSVDGRGAETALRGRLLDHLGLAAPEDLIAWAASATRAEVAALAPEVGRAADAGDAAAGEILETAVRDLEGHVAALLESLGPWQSRPGIALGGGLLERGGALRGSLEWSLAERGLERIERAPDAVRGAARKALRADGIERSGARVAPAGS